MALGQSSPGAGSRAIVTMITGDLVTLLSHHDPANPAPWLLHIPKIPRYHMTVAVHHGLPCCLAGIESYVVPGRVEIFLNDYPTVIDKAEHCQPFTGCQRKDIGGMPVREHEQVALAGGKTIPAGITELVLCNNIIGKRFAEGTFRINHAELLAF